ARGGPLGFLARRPDLVGNRRWSPHGALRWSRRAAARATGGNVLFLIVHFTRQRERTHSRKPELEKTCGIPILHFQAWFKNRLSQGTSWAVWEVRVRPPPVPGRARSPLGLLPGRGSHGAGEPREAQQLQPVRVRRPGQQRRRGLAPPRRPR